MDLSYSPEELAFQEELRAFLRDELPGDIADRVRSGKDLSKSDMERWHAILNARGWLAQNWPRAFGGAEWSAVQRHIYDVEAAAAHAATGATVEDIRATIRARIKSEPRAILRAVDIVAAGTLAPVSGPVTETIAIMLSAEFGGVLLIDQREISP